MHYESPARLLGIPLVHVAIGAAEGGGRARGIAKGWVAVGDVAFGVLLAVGGLAFGGISLGGLSVGVLSVAGLAIGIWSVGGLALGVFALGGAAIAYWAAEGGLAVAGRYAMGGSAIAANAADEAARVYFESSRFFGAAAAAADYASLLILLPLIAPLGAWLNRRRPPR